VQRGIIPQTLYSRLTKKSADCPPKTNKKRWFFLSKLPPGSLAVTPTTPASARRRPFISAATNRYSRVRRRVVINDPTKPGVLVRRRVKEYQHLLFFKRLCGPLQLPFSRKKRLRRHVVRRKTFVARRVRRRINFRNKFLKRRKNPKYSCFFLKFRQKRYKRRSSRSDSRKFFTNIWLVAFIFTKQVRVKKLWYSKLLTKRVLTFFCTNFW
jgi:hypothetical protein